MGTKKDAYKLVSSQFQAYQPRSGQVLALASPTKPCPKAEAAEINISQKPEYVEPLDLCQGKGKGQSG